MKKNIVLFFLMMFVMSSLLAQSSMPLVYAPADIPIYNYSSPDNFQATKIVEARKGNDGNWYCLVKLEALNIKNTRPGFNYYEQPSFINGVYILNEAIYFNEKSQQYYRSDHKFIGYDPNVPGKNEVSKYKSYNQYMPTGEKGFFIWLKANYATATQVGIVPNPGGNSIPTPGVSGGNTFDIMYNIGYSYKKGFIIKNIFFGGWLVRMQAFPLGMNGPHGEYLQVDLVTAKPSN
ncbi:hypothetical protein [Sphingobacterium sp. GVS05A]|uniref:hypothetical protein n=1 Tax=Sphingobacterium sp. GVS05A TaxID=2862679 RepID=UPI001CBF4CFC|nr:hypothetical protein [Sphingobacterium sp. GVS05A]